MSTVQRASHVLSLAFSWKEISFMSIILVALNLVDAVSSFYAINVLGFMELNSLAVGFPAWFIVLKFAICFLPTVCAYTLHRFCRENYLLLPVVFSLVLIEFYAFVVAFNMYNIFWSVTQGS
jgi:hypothetical protein